MIRDARSAACLARVDNRSVNWCARNGKTPATSRVPEGTLPEGAEPNKGGTTDARISDDIQATANRLALIDFIVPDLLIGLLLLQLSAATWTHLDLLPFSTRRHYCF